LNCNDELTAALIDVERDEKVIVYSELLRRGEGWEHRSPVISLAGATASKKTFSDS
jgi:hypothetical protein